MSKFQCSCGHIIRDNTDYLSYKAYYISDQDFYDFLDELEGESRDNFASVAYKYVRDIYQCTKCNNIFIFRGDFFHEFQATQPDSHSLLISSPTTEAIEPPMKENSKAATTTGIPFNVPFITTIASFSPVSF